MRNCWTYETSHAAARYPDDTALRLTHTGATCIVYALHHIGGYGLRDLSRSCPAARLSEARRWIAASCPRRSGYVRRGYAGAPARLLPAMPPWQSSIVVNEMPKVSTVA